MSVRRKLSKNISYLNSKSQFEYFVETKLNNKIFGASASTVKDALNKLNNIIK